MQRGGVPEKVGTCRGGGCPKRWGHAANMGCRSCDGRVNVSGRGSRAIVLVTTDGWTLLRPVADCEGGGGEGGGCCYRWGESFRESAWSVLICCPGHLVR